MMALPRLTICGGIGRRKCAIDQTFFLFWSHFLAFLTPFRTVQVRQIGPEYQPIPVEGGLDLPLPEVGTHEARSHRERSAASRL